MDKQKKILIVEDEAINAMFLRVLLKNKGYHIIGAVATGKDAVENVKKDCPDLVLMDVMLRDSIDGIEAAHILRKNYQFPIIFLSGYDDEFTIKRIEKVQHSWKLTKPVDDRVLTELIEDILQI